MSHKPTSISKSTETWEALSLVTFRKQRCGNTHQAKKNKKASKKPRFQQAAKSHSKIFPKDGLTAIRDFPVGCHPPKGWVAGIHGEWGTEASVSAKEENKEISWKTFRKREVIETNSGDNSI